MSANEGESLDALFEDDPTPAKPEAAPEPVKKRAGGPGRRAGGRWPKRPRLGPHRAPGNVIPPTAPSHADEAQPSYTVNDARYDILKVIADHLNEGGRIMDLHLASRIRRAALAGAVQEVLSQGVLRFPDGLGVMKVQRMAPVANRRLPTGQWITVSRERTRVRFTMGVALKRMLGYEKDYKYVPKTTEPETPDTSNGEPGV